MPANIGDVIEATARVEFNGVEDMINVYECVLGTPGPVSDANVVTDILNWVEGIYLILDGFMSVVTFFRDIKIVNKTQSDILGTYPWPTLVSGLSGSNPLPPGNAGLVSFDTGIPRVSPRKYFGGLTDGALDPDGSLEPGHVVALSLVGSYLLTPFVGVGGDYLYGVSSSKTGQFEFPNSALVTDITGYQRRRRQGRGS